MRSVNLKAKIIIICGLGISLLLLIANVPVEAADEDFQNKVWEAMKALKSRQPVEREEFINIDTKKVIFPHKKHHKIIKQLGKTCKTCHHRKKKGRPPRACKRCHAKRTIISKGKYTRKGRILRQKDVFHFLCGDCHKKMLADGYQRTDGSEANIPFKCHHCHAKKE